MGDPRTGTILRQAELATDGLADLLSYRDKESLRITSAAEHDHRVLGVGRTAEEQLLTAVVATTSDLQTRSAAANGIVGSATAG